jgi:hypothetical protein
MHVWDRVGACPERSRGDSVRRPEGPRLSASFQLPAAALAHRLTGSETWSHTVTAPTLRKLTQRMAPANRRVSKQQQRLESEFGALATQFPQPPASQPLTSRTKISPPPVRSGTRLALNIRGKGFQEPVRKSEGRATANRQYGASKTD